jgi:hypothetical protein
LKFACKDLPVDGEPDWCPLLDVRISLPGMRYPPTLRFDALIGSGASQCIFHAEIGEAVGFDIEDGFAQETIGVSGAPTLL